MFKSLFAATLGMAFMLAPAYAASNDNKLMQIASDRGNLSTFVTAVKAAGFEDKLNGKQNWTILAPTDEAFAKLPAGTIDNLLKPENKAKLQKLLKRHMVEGKIWASNMANEEVELKTAQGSVIKVNARSNPFQVENANIISLNIVADNGKIHTIDNVLLDDAKRASLYPASRYN